MASQAWQKKEAARKGRLAVKKAKQSGQSVDRAKTIQTAVRNVRNKNKKTSSEPKVYTKPTGGQSKKPISEGAKKFIFRASTQPLPGGAQEGHSILQNVFNTLKTKYESGYQSQQAKPLQQRVFEGITRSFDPTGMGKAVFQGVARSGAKTVSTFAEPFVGKGNATFSPREVGGSVGAAIFGEKRIKPLSTLSNELMKKYEGYGKTAQFGAAMLPVALVASDIIPSFGAKSAAKEAIEAVTPRLAMSFLKKQGISASDDMVKAVINIRNADDAADFMKFAKPKVSLSALNEAEADNVKNAFLKFKEKAPIEDFEYVDDMAKRIEKGKVVKEDVSEMSNYLKEKGVDVFKTKKALSGASKVDDVFSPSTSSKALPRQELQGGGKVARLNSGDRIPYTANKAELPTGVKSRGFSKTVEKSKLAPKELSEQLAKETYQVKPNEETASRVKAILELGDDNALKVARDANHPESNATALKLMEDALKKNEFQKFSMLNKEFSPRFTKQGQQIQIISKFGKLTPTGSVRYAEHIVEEANRLSGSKLKLTDEAMGKIKGLAEEVAKAPEGREKVIAIAKMMDKIAEQVPEGIGKKIATLQTMAQLLNPKTAIRNIIGNVALGITDTVSDVVGTGVDKLLSVFPKWSRSMGLPSLGKQLSGAKKGFKLGLEDALLGIDTSGFGTKFDLPTRTFRKGILNGLEKAMNIELRATDRAFYQGAFDDAVNSMMKATKAQKITPEIMAQAGEEALYRTFQNNSLLAKGMVKLKHGLNFGKDFGIGDLINKYPKTPANIVNVGMDYSPLGVFKVAKQVYDITKGIKSVGQIGVRRDLVKQISRALVGTGIIGTGYILAKNKIVSGKVEKDRDVSTLQRITGGGPFRLNISALQRMAKGESADPKNGDTLISYDWLQPNAIPFSIGANMALGDKKAEDALNVAIEGLESGVDTLTQQPVIQGIKRFSQDFASRGLVRAIGNQFAGAPASFVPTIVNQIRQKFGDNITKETYDPNVFREGLNRAIAKVPILENKLPQRTTTLGKPAETYQGGSNSVVNVFFNPAFISKLDETPDAKMALDIFRKTGEKGIIPRIAPEYVFDENGNKVSLNAEQYASFQKYIGEKTSDVFTKLSESKAFQGLDDTEKVNKLTTLLSNISADAKKEIMGIGKGSGKLDLVKALEVDEKFMQIKQLDVEGKFDESDKLINEMSDDEYDIYKKSESSWKTKNSSELNNLLEAKDVDGMIKTLMSVDVEEQDRLIKNMDAKINKDETITDEQVNAFDEAVKMLDDETYKQSFDSGLESAKKMGFTEQEAIDYAQRQKDQAITGDKIQQGNQQIASVDQSMFDKESQMQAEGIPTAQTASTESINLGSNLAQKNNNPGNLRFAGQDGASQGSGGFARFDTPEAGYSALQKQIDLDKSRDLTVQEFVSKYAPPSENNTGQYIQQFNDNLGTDNSTKLSKLDTKDVAKFMAMKESSTQIGEKIASSNIKLNTKEESVVQAVASGSMTTEEAKDTITTAFKEKVSSDPATTATVEKLALVPPVVPYSNIGYIPPEKMYDTFSIYGLIASLKLLQQQPSYFKTPDLTNII
jgi:hypothetical protein